MNRLVLLNLYPHKNLLNSKIRLLLYLTVMPFLNIKFKNIWIIHHNQQLDSQAHDPHRFLVNHR